MSMLLEEFGVTPTERGTGLTCPRSDCGAKFIVNMAELLERKLGGSHPTKTIICPCCSKVSAIPADVLEGQGHTPCRSTRAGGMVEDA